MELDLEARLQGFLRPQPSVTRLPRTVLHVSWNVRRRVYLQTSTGLLPPPADEPLGPFAPASFVFRFRSASDLYPQIRSSLAGLNFTYSVTSVLSPTITEFVLRLAARHPRPPYPSIIVFANLNFVEKLFVDSIHRPLAECGSVPDFVPGTSTEDWEGSDDEEGEEDDGEVDSDSAIGTPKRRKLDTWGGEEESCILCLETFSDGEEVIPLPCEHIYHESCIVDWLEKCRSCPRCRSWISCGTRSLVLGKQE